MPLVYSDWARLVAMTAAVWCCWGGIWGLFYRKFFFDGVGGTLGPQGIIPPDTARPFVAIIVDAPILQILAIVQGILILATEWPLPQLQKTVLCRSRLLKAVLLFWNGFIAMMIYQTFDAFIVSFVASGIYVKAHAKGEGKTARKPGQANGGGEAV